MGTIAPRILTVRGGSRVTLRSAGPGDAPGLIAHRLALTGTTEHFVVTVDEIDRDEARVREWIGDHADDPGKLALLAVHEGAIIGGLNFHAGNRRRIAHHGSFGVGIAPLWQGCGVGTALIRALLDWAAADATLERVTLGVFATNTGARALYRRLGFVEEGVTPRFVRLGPGRYLDDIQMAIYVKPGVAPPGFNTHEPG